MADAARKAVDSALLDTWSWGDSIIPLITDKGPVTKGGDSVDMGYRNSSTVHTSESAAVAATNVLVDTLTVNRPKFINDGITQAQHAQLLNGDGNYARELARSAGADLMFAIERDIIEYLIREVAGASVAAHRNLAADAVLDDDVNITEARMRETRGIANSGRGLFWLVSPQAESELKSVSQYAATQNAAQAGVLGLPQIGQLNNIPVFQHNGVPGFADASRITAATSAVTIASNVATATVPQDHGFVVGQQIYTTGLTSNIAQNLPVAVTATTATSISYALAGVDGPLADGEGTILSASSMALLCYGPWIGFATDGAQPFTSLVKLSGGAGWTLQLFHHLGRVAHSGAVRVLHLPDGI